MEWLRKIAPTAATLLGGPLAGLAVEAIGSALDLPNATKDKVVSILQSGTLTAEQIAAVKKAEADLVIRLRELDIKAEEIAAADRDSARKREISTGDVWTPRLLGALIVVAWGLIQWHLLTSVVDPSMRELVARLLGTLDAALMAVLYYYYGSSSGSAAKNQALTDRNR